MDENLFFLITKATGQQIREFLCSQFLFLVPYLLLLFFFFRTHSSAVLTVLLFQQKHRQTGRCLQQLHVQSRTRACAIGQAGHPRTSELWVIWSFSAGKYSPYPQPITMLTPLSLPCGCKPCSRKIV